jgi:hypothetical protein
MGMPALPHPAANRIVQSAFLIGCAMRKALSISQAPNRNMMTYLKIRQKIGLFRLLRRPGVT